MAFTHRVTTVYQTDGNTVINLTESVTGTNQGVDIEATIAAEVVTEYDVMICPEKVQSMMLASNQPLEIKTQDEASPVTTIVLKAGVPLVWTLNSWWPIPFALGTDVTKLFLKNNGPADAAVKIRVLSN